MLGVCTVSTIYFKNGHKFSSAQRAQDTNLANIECVLSFAFGQRKDFSHNIVLEKAVCYLKITVPDSPHVASASHIISANTTKRKVSITENQMSPETLARVQRGRSVQQEEL